MNSQSEKQGGKKPKLQQKNVIHLGEEFKVQTGNPLEIRTENAVEY